MRNQRLVSLLIILLLLAGCSAITDSGSETTTTPGATSVDETSSPTIVSSSESTETGTTTPTQTTTEAPRINPFDSRSITVGVSAPPNQTVNLTEISREAVAYWQDNREAASQYRENPVELVFKPEAADPDVLIEYKSTIANCDGGYSPDTFLFCSEWVTTGQVVEDQITIEVANRYTRNDTELLTREALSGIFGYSSEDYNSGSIDEPALRDPWPSKDTVIVGVTDGTGSDRNIEPLVKESLEYWENSTYGDYDINWVLKPDAASPDVEVHLVDSIETCGHTPSDKETLGCAPNLERTEPAGDDVLVRIADGYTDESITETIKHEFGHVLGLSHGEEPMPLMNESKVADTLPATDVQNRSIGWESPEITVGVTESASAEMEEQTRAVVEYLNSRESQPDELSLKYVGVDAEADIVVQEDPEDVCNLHAGSCPRAFGRSPDTDDALEYYTEVTIYVEDLDGDTLGWHIGYWIDRVASPTMTDEAWDEDDDDRDGWR
ncbi:hypothetical protein [Haloarchaeobius amylolyticus]|uniref:hypothetical protein n=1 Tax=Haloarchaeobius amylolyticus TaxID=1198296 RepID=UPI00226FD54A|nr:hypothetical protein [Haloarchaeobius amylolyticus]